MRPRIFTLRNFFLVVVAGGLVGGLVYWASLGFPLPGSRVPSTAGKIAFVSDRSGHKDLYLMDGATGANAAALTDDASEDREPAWSPDGQQLAFASDRNGIHQVCLMNAAPGQRVVALTRTNSTKEAPYFGPDKRLFFLDSGKIASIGADASDAKAVFPTVEQKRERLASVFAHGGVARFAVSRDGQRIAAVVNQEIGQALVMYVPAEEAVVFFGVAARIFPEFLKDNSLSVLFVGGGPVGESPEMLLDAKTSQDENYRAPDLPSAEESMQGVNMLVRYDPQLKMGGVVRLPVTPDGITISPDEGHIAVWASDAKKGSLVMLSMGSAEDRRISGKPLFQKPCQSVAWSPDGKQVAFASGGDIYAASAEGTTPPVNLTNGKGKNASPVWSPAAPETR